MREVIFLNFGNSSNYISSHFWNLNDEMFKFEDKYEVENSVLYDDNFNPRCLTFDFSESIRPYFIQNEKLSSKKKKEIQDEVQNQNKLNRVDKYDQVGHESNFIEMMNEYGLDESEYLDYKNKNTKIEEEEVNTNKKGDKNSDENNSNKLSVEQIFKLPDEEIYDYLDFENNIKNWNDFLQPKFHRKTFNEISTSDVDVFSRNSYLKGNQFLESDNFKFTYMEPFEDNFRKLLEDCDKIELLHINTDFNSFWGGISNSMMDVINDNIPKVLKVNFGVDNHSSFYDLNDNSFDVEKLINYLWFLTDLNSNKYSNSIFMPIYKNQNPSLIKEVFNYKKENNLKHDPVYEFYSSSITGINMHNLYMPLRSKYFNNSSILNNLVHTTSTSLNFIESDVFFNMDNENMTQNFKNNGTIFNQSRNIRAKDFSWKKLFERSYRMNKFNSTIIHGFNDKFNIMGEKLEGFFMKHSGINYTSIDKLDLPLCYPRKIYNNSEKDKKEKYVKEMPLMTNYRPFPEYPLSHLKFFPDYYKENDLDIRKYLCNHDMTKYMEFKEKIEEFYNIIDSYEYMNDAYQLGIKLREDDDDECDY